MSETNQIEEAIKIIVERITDHFQPERIILFGSRARGDARPDSDIDILVVLPVCEDRKAVTISMLKSVADLPVSKDILVISTKELETRGRLESTVIHPALQEGRILYAR